MKYNVYQDKHREWRWRLIARNGKIVADCGEGYTRKAKCLKTVRKINSNAFPIVELE